MLIPGYLNRYEGCWWYVDIHGISKQTYSWVHVPSLYQEKQVVEQEIWHQHDINCVVLACANKSRGCIWISRAV